MRKHLLYLTNTELTAWLWSGSRLSGGERFANDEEGHAALRIYLGADSHVPALLLIDIIEENFQHENVPHVIGKAHRQMVARRLLQTYHDTPFRHATRQGREKSGRRDDVMLLAALTNAPLLQPWLSLVQSCSVPVAAIYSCALLSQTLHQKLRLGTAPTLLVSHLSSGLRQSFFIDGKLRFSRLTRLSVDEPAACAASIDAEVEKTRLFLVNTRQLPRGQTLHVAVIDSDATLACMPYEAPERPGLHYQLFNHAACQRALGVRKVPQSVGVDPLLLAWLGSKQPAAHYDIDEHSRDYTLWKARVLLYVAAAATLTGCLLWSGANAFEALGSGSALRQLDLATAQHQKIYRQVVDSMPKTVVNPHDMKSVVDLHQLLLDHRASPEPLMVRVSQALNRLPDLVLDELSWETTDPAVNPDPAAAAASGTLPAPTTPVDPATMPGARLGLPGRAAEVMILKGTIVPFAEDYRSALASVKKLSDELERDPQVHVDVLHQPLDTSPNVGVVGELGNPDMPASARFELRIRWQR